MIAGYFYGLAVIAAYLFTLWMVWITARDADNLFNRIGGIIVGVMLTTGIYGMFFSMAVDMARW